MKLTLRIRTYADTPAVALVWLVQGNASPAVAEKLAEWFEAQGVKVERETR